MSNIGKSSGTNVGVELTSITVADKTSERGYCWKFNIGDQFPIIPSNIENGKATIAVDSPHKGYSIQTNMKNGKMNGESRILNSDHIEIATLVFVDGVAKGPCKLCDDDGRLFFEGCLENGYREGKGKELDEKGIVVYDGLFKKGKRENISACKEKAGYWKEVNDNNEIISICQKNDKFQNDGICYFYSNGCINRVSECKNGEEVSVVKQFEGKKMTEFVNGVRQYEGEYKDSFEDNFPREGKGKEYDINNQSLVYNGSFSNGKRHGEGILYKDGKIIYDGKWDNGIQANNKMSPCALYCITVLEVLFWGGAIIVFISLVAQS